MKSVVFRLIVTAALAFSAAVSGCASRPTASLEAARVTELTTEHVSITFDVKVNNPWLVPLPLAEAAGNLASPVVNNGTPFLNVTAGGLNSVPAQGSSAVPLSGTFAYLPVLAGLPSLHPGDEVPYTATLQLTASVPATNEKVKLPEIRQDGKLPLLALPDVSIAGVSWPTVSLDQVSGSITLRIGNRNKFSIGPGTANGKVLLKAVRSGGDAELATFSAALPNVIDGLETGTLVVNVSFAPASLFDAATWSGLRQALGTPSNLRLTGTLQGSTPYVPVSLSFDTH